MSLFQSLFAAAFTPCLYTVYCDINKTIVFELTATFLVCKSNIYCVSYSFIFFFTVGRLVYIFVRICQFTEVDVGSAQTNVLLFE